MGYLVFAVFCIAVLLRLLHMAVLWRKPVIMYGTDDSLDDVQPARKLD